MTSFADRDQVLADKMEAPIGVLQIPRGHPPDHLHHELHRGRAPPVPKADQDQGRLPERRQPAETLVHGHHQRQQEVDHADPELESHRVAAGDLLRGPA